VLQRGKFVEVGGEKTRGSETPHDVLRDGPCQSETVEGAEGRRGREGRRRWWGREEGEIERCENGGREGGREGGRGGTDLVPRPSSSMMRREWGVAVCRW